MQSPALALIHKAKQNHACFLDLGNCGLTELPDELMELPWLERVNLGTFYYNSEVKQWVLSGNAGRSNVISTSSLSKLAQLPQLKSLDLRGNQITDIRALAKLHQLQTLGLSSNQITDIRVLAGLHQLQRLDLGGTNITDIWVLAQLRQLQTLDLQGNQITDIRALAHLTRLQTLDLQGNQITDIRVLAKLTQLHRLNLYGNRIPDINVLSHLTQLQTLDLQGNKITDIRVLAKLTQLHRLNLYGNQITDISALSQLPQLQRLNLGSNQITDISVLSQLPQLQTLDLLGNQITDIRALAKLHQLQRLDLGGTNITDISVLSQLPQLQILDLRGTNTTDIRVLAKLPQIESVNLSSTKVTNLSPLLPLLYKGIPVKWSEQSWEGKGIYVKDCPLVTPPVGIVQLGNEAVLNYFRQIEEQGGTVPLYEAKLIVVGEPGAGKTSLTEKLLDEKHQVIPDDPQKKSTLGINVRENWHFEDHKRANEKFTAHIWDFGGQEIQYMTHQFFLTPESLYVLVADDRKQHTLFPYWFEVIQLLSKDETGNNSPVLVVLNERNNKSITNFDLNEYRKKYPQMRVDQLEVDLSDEDLTRFKTVRTKIEHSLCTLSHVGRQLPRRWSDVRKELITRKKIQNHISEQEFAVLCSQFQVTRTEDQQLISKYLHQLGVILHFQHDMQLRDFIVINPSWALKAVYAVLENKEVQKRHGRFTEADLDQYWQALSVEERVKILNLMKKDSFEICYPVGKQTYIAPQLLPSIRPDFEWNNYESLKCHFFYRFMPKGIMIRLIVRKHEYLGEEPLVWARGAMFHRLGCKVLVTEEETERNGLIAIEVTGPANSRIRALNFIRDEIEDIHRKWFPSIEYEERAPCNCPDCRQSDKPTFFSWEVLIQCLDESTPTIQCFNKRVKNVLVLPLLEGIYKKEHIESTLLERRVAPVQIASEQLEGRIHRIPNQIDLVSATATESRKVATTPDNPPLSQQLPTNGMKTINWFYRVAAATVIAFLFFALAKPGSKLDFLGWFKAEQGGTTSTTESGNRGNPTPANLQSTATIIGRIKINGHNASAEDVKQVYVKDETAGQRVTLDNNLFRLRNVKIPSDRLITIAIDLKDGSSPSFIYTIPEANGNVVDMGEVLLETKPTGNRQRRGAKGSGATIIINNQNVQNNK